MHTPNYLEFTVADIDAAKAFYAKAFGFEFVDCGPGYAGVNGEGIEIGFHRGETRQPLLAGFQTDDIAKARETVVAAGGTILQEIYEFPGGRRFHFADPGGNEMLVYQYGE